MGRIRAHRLHRTGKLGRSRRKCIGGNRCFCGYHSRAKANNDINKMP